MREEGSLRVFEKGVLRIFGPKRDEVTGEWRRLHSEELNDLYFSPYIIRMIKSRRMRWAVYVARIEESRDVYMVLVGKPERTRPLGRLRHGWAYNIKKDLQEVGSCGMGWFDVVQDRDRWRAIVNGITEE